MSESRYRNVCAFPWITIERKMNQIILQVEAVLLVMSVQVI